MKAQSFHKTVMLIAMCQTSKWLKELNNRDGVEPYKGKKKYH